MKTRWIIVGLIISLIIHTMLLAFLGKTNLIIHPLNFIETYFFETKQKKVQNVARKISKSNKDTNISPQIESSEKIDGNFLPKTDESDDISSPTYTAHQKEIVEQDENIQTNFNTQTPNPFVRFINETMKFDIYWSGIYVGFAVIYVRGNENEITITSKVNSAGFISNFYYVNDKAQSKIEYGRPKHFALVQIEGRYRGNKETFFDYENKEILFINHIKNSSTYHKGIDKIYMDVLSGFFYLRTKTLNVNDSVAIDIFDSNKFATVNVQILKEEKMELNNKEVDAIVIKPLLDTEGLFKRKGDIIIWLSKDENKIPLKVETKIPVGRVVAELREYKKE